MNTSGLGRTLAEWTDLDFAAFELAQCVGLMGADVDFAGRAKHVFWSRNPSERPRLRS